jgi:predicted phage gp36 major capsid-like protein
MKQSLRYGALVVAVASMATLASCSSKITEEQLARLRELRQKEQTLAQQIRAKRDERSRLQSEVNARRAELDRCAKDKAFVQSKLAQWPDVWPDWKDTPAPSSGSGSTPRR